MNKFKEDLKIWLRFELFVTKVCNQVFWLKVSKNTNEIDVDLISDDGYSIEIKYDIASKKTKNYFFEYSYRWKRSWIIKYNCEYFAIWDENKFGIYDRQVLWEYVKQFWIHKKWWDNNNSLAYVIEIEEIIDLAIYKYERWVKKQNSQIK